MIWKRKTRGNATRIYFVSCKKADSYESAAACVCRWGADDISSLSYLRLFLNKWRQSQSLPKTVKWHTIIEGLQILIMCWLTKLAIRSHAYVIFMSVCWELLRTVTEKIAARIRCSEYVQNMYYYNTNVELKAAT